MSYTVLATQYRPTRFDEVVGHDAIKKTLQQAFLKDRLPHAILFSSPSHLPGIGKTTLARILAKLWNCEHPHNAEPCNECESCRLISTDSHPDVLEMDAASHGGVADIRDINEIVDYGAQIGNVTVLIFDEAHMLTTAAANAALKMLEKEQGRVKFIFATTELKNIMPTILSRTMHFELHPITTPQLIEYIQYILTQEEIPFETEAIQMLSRKFDGSVRSALMLLEKIIAYGDEGVTVSAVVDTLGFISFETLFSISDAIDTGTSLDAIHTLLELYTQGHDAIDVLSAINEHIVCLFTASKDVQDSRLNDTLYEMYVQKIKKYNPRNWHLIFETFKYWTDKITSWKGKQIALEYFAIDLHTAWNSKTVIDRMKLLKIAHEFDGKIMEYTSERAVIQTGLGNQLQIVTEVDFAETGYFCVYPFGVEFILENPTMKAPELIEQKIIREK